MDTTTRQIYPVAEKPPRIGYAIAEILAALPISRTAFYAAVGRGEIRLMKIGGRSFVPAAEVERLMRGLPADPPRDSAA